MKYIMNEDNPVSFKDYLFLVETEHKLFEDLMAPFKTKAKKINSTKNHNLVVKVKPGSLKVFIRILSKDYKYIKYKVSDKITQNSEQYYIVALHSNQKRIKSDIEHLIVPGVKVFNINHKNYE